MANGLQSTRPATAKRWVLVAAVLVGLAFLASQEGWTDRLDLFVADQRASVITHDVELPITMVDIDAASLAEVGLWPWPRSLHARMVDRASALGARAVAFDVDFSTASNPAEDEAFAHSLANASPETFLAAFVQEATTGSGRLAATLPIDQLLASSWPAAVNVPLDADGRVRRFTSFVETGSETLTSMPALLAGREAPSEIFGIDLSIDPRTLRRVSFVDLMEGRVPREAIEGRALLVGATALELRDFFAMPGHGTVSGSTIIALAAETLHQGRATAALPVPPFAFLAVAILGLALLRYTRGHRTPILLGLCALGVELAALWLHHGWRLDLASSGLLLALAGVAFVAILREFDLKTLLLAMSRVETANSRLMLERVIEDGFDAIFVIDGQGEVVRANAAARDLALPDAPPGGAFRLEHFPPDLRRAVLATRQAGPSASRTLCDLEIAGDGPSRILEYTLKPLDLAALGAGRAEHGQRLICVTLRDVTQVRRAQDRMRRLAMEDSLTGLANRRALELRLESERGSPALIVFDLDRFKSVNDRLGHDIGDLVLRETGRRASAALGPDAFVARIGGDEFAAILPASDRDRLAFLAKALAEAVERPMTVGGHRVGVGLSAGFASTGDAGTVQALMTDADMALQEAKRSPGRLIAFVPGMDERRRTRLALEADLAGALDRGEIELAYQPQVEIASGRVIGAEALLRWNHPARGPVSPGVFIPLAEETGLIHGLGTFALAQACRQAVRWDSPIPVAVNVSSHQFQKGNLAEAVEEALERSGLPASRLELEITESAFVHDGEDLAETFRQLTARGIRFSLDDFGTGYSSLGYLHRFPISKIKIDRSFVIGLPTDGHSLAIVRSIMALGEGLAMRVIAEGIEQPGQAEALAAFGCREGQGHLYHRALPEPAMAALLSGRRQAAGRTSASMPGTGLRAAHP